MPFEKPLHSPNHIDSFNVDHHENDGSQNEISREHHRSNNDSDFFKLDDCTINRSECKDTPKLNEKSNNTLQHQGGVVPIQRILTLEDAVNNQATNRSHENSNAEGGDDG